MTATPFSIGLTGGIGSGKSMVADLFEARGAALIDTDRVAHQLTAPGGQAIPLIRQEFGPRFIASTGALDRAVMRETVFTDAAARKRLEAILHPMIRDECARLALQARGDYLIFVVPLLVESHDWQKRMSRILVVDCPEEQQILRVMDRNGLSEAEVRAIMATQASREQRLAAADDVIRNDGRREDVAPQVDKLHALYRSLSQNL